MRISAIRADRRRWYAAVALVSIAGLGLRLWGIGWGLPFAYNLDERAHFVPRAVGFFQNGSLDPNYQLNPAGLMQWIAGALWLFRGGRTGVIDGWATDPGSIWITARIASAVLSTSAIALVYAAGARMFDRRTGLLAAALLAFAFLPAHYGKLALNDAPSLAPTALALFAIAGIVRFGRRRDYLLAGTAIGLAIGIKYNAAFLGLPLLTAAVVRAAGGIRAGGDDAVARSACTPNWRAAIFGLCVAAIAAFAAFVVMDPYAVLRPGFFRSELEHLSDYTAGGLLLGETQRSGYRYYAWALFWGFGVAPTLLLAVGVVLGVRRYRWQALILIPAPVIFVAIIGSQGRYFARYEMPVYPLLALLAASGGIWVLDALLSRLRLAGGARTVAGSLLVVAVLAQGLMLIVHNNVVLSRPDTRTTAREWMTQNIPAGTPIVVEPMVPREWYVDRASLRNASSRVDYRWPRLTRTGADKRRLARANPRLASRIGRAADFANHGFTLFPGMLDFYRENGACWIVSGSMQSGRVQNNPGRVPDAVKYYRALEEQALLRFSISPFGGPEAKDFFQYDQAFNFVQLRYRLPGPSVRIYRLKRCSPGGRAASERRSR